MDRKEEEMQFMGFADIYKESNRIILRCRKIFKDITFTLILPLSCFIFIAHRDISSLIFTKLDNLCDFPISEWDLFWFFKGVYCSFLLIYYNLSTSVVVYTVSSIYRVGDEVTLKKVTSVVPRAWKRLTVTFFCNLSCFIVYNIAAVIILYLLAFRTGKSQFVGVIFFVVLLIYAVGFVYTTIIWHLANVVSVLEDSYGFEAMMKSKELIKGKLMVTMFIFSHLNCSFVLIQILFGRFVLYGSSMVLLQKTAIGLICFWTLCTLILFGLVIQTIIYFVCKSYHIENIEKSSLAVDLAV